MTEIMDVTTELVKPAQTTAPVTEPSSSEVPQVSKWHGDDYSELVENKKWAGADDVLKAYSYLEGFKGIAELAANVPETADGYEYTYAGEGDSPINDELLNGFFQLAHSKKWPKAFVQDVIDFQLDAVTATDNLFKTQSTEREQENIKAMKGKWGEANYDATFRDIFFRKQGIDKEPEIVNMLITIKNSDAEDTITLQTPRVATQTPLEELDEIKKSESFIQRFHPKHKETMARFIVLNQQVADSGQAQQPRI